MDIAHVDSTAAKASTTAGREARPTPVSNRRHIEQDFELPVPAVAIAFLVIMTASALYLGHNGTAEAIAVCVAWVVTCTGLVIRRPGG